MIVPLDDASIERGAEILRAGGLVAFPTETVYGLGARADSSAAVRRIYEAKGRPPENPSIVHAATAERAFDFAEGVGVEARAVAARFWPGPLTLVLPVRRAAIAPEVTAGGETVALRVPGHAGARALLAAVDLPIAAPSANRSNTISPTTALHVERSLGARVDLVLDGGPTGFGIESAIVDLASSPPRLLRRGAIGFPALAAEIAGLVDVGSAVTRAHDVARAPGTFARHYAPRAPLTMGSRDEIARAAGEADARGERTGMLVIGDPAGLGFADAVEVLASDPAAYARDLYAALHRLDDAACDRLFAEAPPLEPAWAAVRDRLARASTRDEPK